MENQSEYVEERQYAAHRFEGEWKETLFQIMKLSTCREVGDVTKRFLSIPVLSRALEVEGVYVIATHDTTWPLTSNNAFGTKSRFRKRIR
jgi:hypothetical protein